MPGKSTTENYATASPDYFRVMRIPLLQGLYFPEQDSPSNPNAAMVGETRGRRYFPNPIGRQMRFGFPPKSNVSREIVGAVRDVVLGRKHRASAGIRQAVHSGLQALASRREKMYRLAAEVHQIG